MLLFVVVVGVVGGIIVVVVVAHRWNAVDMGACARRHGLAPFSREKAVIM